ncbi:DoxX family protein [Halalkalicoccus sp. NIPERK01]|uniref:DoxX family protein n=1 Tax=Halalkalicoccus sp. NIPERK01 TaxID=3053469 RepID=UPI00256F0DBE|nr:DoxX family protein [Halalkalicoccus sp. NIPERK01]MDL5360967.1 DoxX family protein [Halalkalicoccus sp. NIPERK01]
MSDDTPSLLGRLLFGGSLGLLAYSNFQELDAMIGYADSKDVPEADRLVPFASGMLAFGSLAIILWRVPRLAAGAIAGFLVGVTPLMHDFWNLEGQERDTEQTNFLQNLALLGAALAFIGRASED